MTAQATESTDGPLLTEVSWEVCNQIGGIYTVLRSKAPTMVDWWGGRYLLVGPYMAASASVEFEPAAADDAVGRAVEAVNAEGIPARHGHWLVTGRPRVVLLDHTAALDRLETIRRRLERDHGIPPRGQDPLIGEVLAFGEATRLWFHALAAATDRRLLAHFHEWLSGPAIPMLRQEGWPGSTIFTTHATLLGRYLAQNDDGFHERLFEYDPGAEARRFNVEAQHGLESGAAREATVFTTLSEPMSAECGHLLGRRPDVLLPNGLNIQRFAAVHEFQNLHRRFKEQIHRFTIGHFFPSYRFDLDRTLYLFTSGRFEPRNKGMDVTIEAMARLNHRLKQMSDPPTVVMFIVTQRPVHSVNVNALHSSSMLTEFDTVCDGIKEQIGDRLFYRTTAGGVPDLNDLVDEYWMLRLRRLIHAWDQESSPGVATHDLQDPAHDPVLNQIRTCQLSNGADDPVKLVYHPQFIKATSPLLRMEYDQFVRGCHLGVFPSYYEPWGYTPLEAIALGVPAVTSDLSGFGTYLQQHLPDLEGRGVFVVRRREASFEQAAEQLTGILERFARTTRRDRIDLRNEVERFTDHFDWHNLATHYGEAHEMARRAGGG